MLLSACSGDSNGSSTLVGDTSWVRRWNQIAVDASGLDHTPTTPSEDRVFGEQLGPARASRAMAIVHIAMFEAINAVAGGYRSYIGLEEATAGASVKAAVAQAAHDTLAVLFPSQSSHFAAELDADLGGIADDQAKDDGRNLGRTAASAILSLREQDSSDIAEPVLDSDWFTSDEPGHWRKDPIGQHPVVLGGYWSEVTPFVMQSADQFRVPPPPALDSAEYAAAYEEAKALGGDGIVTPTVRDDEGTFIGIYWAYDGTPSLCAPPRLYNQIALVIAEEQELEIVELARLLALINVAMADAGIAVWESKYYYDFWRPITGIREADEGTGPTGQGDGNQSTIGDPIWVPLCAPASNLAGLNFTPPFPAYPSGHAGFGGALFQTMRRFYGRDDISFTFVSDEFNGITSDNEGNVRELRPRSFTSFSQAEEENGQSRIYLGIHWVFDKVEGINQGRQVADYVFDNLFVPTS